MQLYTHEYTNSAHNASKMHKCAVFIKLCNENQLACPLTSLDARFQKNPHVGTKMTPPHQTKTFEDEKK